MKKDSENQLFFDFEAPAMAPAEPPAPVAVEAVKESIDAVPAVENLPEVSVLPDNAVEHEPIRSTEPVCTSRKKAEDNPRHFLYQAVLAQLVRDGAAGAALHVPCRRHKFKASAAAYFSEGKNHLNLLQSCVLVDVYSQRKECIPECAGSQAVAAELTELRRQRAAMEEQIKLDEPELRREDELFDEFRSFDFARSCNKEYHKLCRRISSLQQSLYKGTRMEQLARSAVADYLIIAVPENVISVDELPDGWGLWYITQDRKVREVKAPESQFCTPENRIHLVQNIGRCALNSVLFANGVRINADQSVRFTRVPRARRK